jgi:hypothetical protein
MRSLYRSRQIEITMISIRPPSTPNSSVVELNRACVSGVHLPGLLTCDDSSVITQTRRIDAISPTIRNGSHTSVPAHGIQDFDDHEHEQQSVDGKNK